jgi:FKBP-type peptidyl-prolyl cis-trans isomerase
MLCRVCAAPKITKENLVPKDRTSATITIVGIIAIAIMAVALLASSQYQAGLAQQTADAQTALAPTNDALTQVANDRLATQAILAETATSVAAQQAVTAVALATNAVGSDVQTTESGLQYRVVTEGDGAHPTASDTVTVHYRGILTDGSEFDSSYSRNQPVTFPLNQVISGWTEGLQLMSVGSTYIFTIPPELAYGEEGRPPVIPQSATLIFEVTLLDIPSQVAAEPTSAAAPTEEAEATAEATSAPDVTAEATTDS